MLMIYRVPVFWFFDTDLVMLLKPFGVSTPALGILCLLSRSANLLPDLDSLSFYSPLPPEVVIGYAQPPFCLSDAFFMNMFVK